MYKVGAREKFLAGVFALRGGFSSFASFPKGVRLLFVIFSTNKNARLANVLNGAEDKNPDKKLSIGFSFKSMSAKKLNFLFLLSACVSVSNCPVVIMNRYFVCQHKGKNYYCCFYALCITVGV